MSVRSRWLVTPSLPDGWGAPDAVVLRADLDARTGCVEIDDDVALRSRRGRGAARRRRA